MSSGNGGSDPQEPRLRGDPRFSVSIPDIIAFIEKEIRDSAAVRSHLERDSRSRRTWAATERAYEKVLEWILQHQEH